MDTPCPKCDDTGSRIINNPSDWWSEGQLHEACDCPAGVEARKQWETMLRVGSTVARNLPPLGRLQTPNELAGLAQCQSDYCTLKLITDREQRTGECHVCAEDGPPCRNGVRSFGWLDCRCDRCEADRWALMADRESDR